MTGVFEELRPALNCRVNGRILALKRRAGRVISFARRLTASDIGADQTLTMRGSWPSHMQRLSGGETALDGLGFLFEHNSNLPNGLPFHEKAPSLPHLLTQVTLLSTVTAPHRAIFCLIGARNKRQTTSFARQSRLAQSQILRRHVGKTGQERRCLPVLLEGSLGVHVHHWAEGPAQEVD